MSVTVDNSTINTLSNELGEDENTKGIHVAEQSVSKASSPPLSLTI